MPTTFDDRERAFEAKFAHDAEFRFRLTARRDKLFARWAAARLHLPDPEADALVVAALHVPDGPGHDGALMAQVGAALAAHRDTPQTAELAAALEACARQAREQLLGQPPEHWQTS